MALDGGRIEARHLLDVGAGGEDPAAPHHRSPDSGIVANGCDVVAELLRHLPVQGIDRRTLEPDLCDSSAHLHLHEFRHKIS